MSYAAKPVPVRDDGNNSLALASLILGIVGLVTGGCPFSLAAAITGWMGMKREPQGTAKIGFWLGVVGMILQALLGLFILLFFGAALGIGLTAVDVKPAPMAPAPPAVVKEAEPTTSEPAPIVDSTADPSIESSPPDAASEANPIEPTVEELPETAP
jgi:hypothetical protein